MNRWILLVMVILLLILYRLKNVCVQKNDDIWIGGPSSHVPKPMVRWGFEES